MQYFFHFREIFFLFLSSFFNLSSSLSLEDYEVNELIRISQQSSPPPAIVPGVVPGSVAAGSLGKA